MLESISFKEGFSFIFEEKQKKINILQLRFYETIVAINWMEVTDFVAILECALKNKLGTKKKYEIGGIVVFGEIEREFFVCIELDNFQNKVIKFDIVQTQQIVSKLNKLLHMANKLHVSESSLYL